MRGRSNHPTPDIEHFDIFNSTKCILEQVGVFNLFIFSNTTGIIYYLYHNIPPPPYNRSTVGMRYILRANGTYALAVEYFTNTTL